LYRPRYPDALFDWLLQQVPNHDRAWDCGTGTGQAALPLAERFDQVIATDPSEAQIAEAERRANVQYAVMTSERSGLRNHCAGLVTVAQALHWFDLDLFYGEVRRVIRPGGVCAVWMYALFELGDSVLDARIRSFYTDGIGRYWPAERAIVDAGYSRLNFPFVEMQPPTFAMQASWTLEQLGGYLGTWSAVTRYRKANGMDPVGPFIEELARDWGEPDQVRQLRWPLEVRAGFV
jgi:SAM-dependent methyltransferase